MREKKKRKKKRNNQSPFRMEATVPATVVPVVPVAAVAAAGGAGAPPPMEANASAGDAKGAEEPLLGRMSFSYKNEGRLRRLFKPVEGLKGVGEFSPLGGLSDPSVRYLGKIDESLREKTEIVFYTLESKEVGRVTFSFKSKTPELYLNGIETSKGEMGKGYGKRMVSAVMDLARKAGCEKVSLDSYPSAVSFYLQADPPFTFNESNNNRKYTKRRGKLIKRGINNKTATRTAGNVFQNGNDSVFHIVPMHANLPKPHRANRKNRTRRRTHKG